MGDSVRVTLISGKILSGNIEDISPEEITLGKNGNSGYEKTTIGISEVALFEVEGTAGPLGLLRGSAIIVGVLVGTVVVLILATGASPAGN